MKVFSFPIMITTVLFLFVLLIPPSQTQSQYNAHDEYYDERNTFNCYECMYRPSSNLGLPNCNITLTPDGIPLRPCSSMCSMKVTKLKGNDVFIRRTCDTECHEKSSNTSFTRCCFTEKCNHFNPHASTSVSSSSTVSLSLILFLLVL